MLISLINIFDSYLHRYFFFKKKCNEKIDLDIQIAKEQCANYRIETLQGNTLINHKLFELTHTNEILKTNWQFFCAYYDAVANVF